MTNWTIFTTPGTRGSGECRVSLNTRGVFTLNQTAFHELGSPEAVELLFDTDQRLIGLRPVDKSVEHAYAVRPQKRNRLYLISAKAFCRHFRVMFDTTVRFRNVDVKDGVLVLDTAQITAVNRGSDAAELDDEKEADLAFDARAGDLG